MPRTARLFLVLGCIAALIAVATGAFGAHALKARIAPELLPVYKTGVEYHFYHALGLILVGLAAFQLPDSACLRRAGWAMLAGIALFSGSLYAMTFTGMAPSHQLTRSKWCVDLCTISPPEFFFWLCQRRK